ncbi:MAG: hypothetical protein ACRC2K_07650, partial [Clostridium sp.]
IFLNTLGFGAYYDRDFLTKLTSEGGTGTFSHIDEITDYKSTVLDFAETANKTELVSVDINGDDYFVLGQNKRVKGNSTINSLRLNSNNLVVAFDCEISLNEENIKYSSKKFNKSYLEDFLYSISLYHVINEDIDSAEVTIAQTGNLDAYSKICNCYSFIEKGKAIKALTSLINNKEERKKNPQVKISVTPIEDEPLCFLEVIEEILKEPKATLLWDKSYKYKRIGVKSKSIDDSLKFISSPNEYGKIVNLSIGSSKLNVGVKVEIDGCVQNTKSKLKLDCKIFKDYNIFLNGNINTPLLWCILPKKMRDKYKNEGFILKNRKWNGKMVSILDLTKLKATNKRIFKSLTSDDISNLLYDIEVLSCKQWALNTVIKEIQSNYSMTKLDASVMYPEEKEARIAFRVDNNGVFTSSKIQSDTTTPYEIYPANYLEWKVDKFPQKKFKDSFKEEFSKLINEEDILSSYNDLITLLINTRKDLREKEFKVNLVRISSALCKKSLFMWNEEFEKDKKQMDKVLNTNMVVGGTNKISIKKYENFSIRQDKYVVLTKCN